MAVPSQRCHSKHIHPDSKEGLGSFTHACRALPCGSLNWTGQDLVMKLPSAPRGLFLEGGVDPGVRRLHRNPGTPTAGRQLCLCASPAGVNDITPGTTWGPNDSVRVKCLEERPVHGQCRTHVCHCALMSIIGHDSCTGPLTSTASSLTFCRPGTLSFIYTTLFCAVCFP